MGLGGLVGFMIIIWAVILALAAFLVAFVAPLDGILGSQVSRLVLSAIQAAIAIALLMVLILSLSKMKKLYIEKRLRRQKEFST